MPVQYMHQGTVKWGPRGFSGMAPHPTPEGVLGLFPPCLSKAFTPLPPGFGQAGSPRPFT